MPKQVPEQELEAISALVAVHSEGMQAEDIRQGLAFALPPRMLQRRLKRLAEEGKIVSRGRGKGKRYFPAVSPGTGSPMRLGAGEAERLPLSREGIEIRTLVNRPLSARRPVGYQAGFLDAYQPNVSAYLPPALRRELAEMGRVGNTGLPAGTYIRRIMDRLLIDLSWNSSRLEGNTYSLLETQRLLESGENAEGKDVREAQMILNHKAAIEMLAEQAEEIGFNAYTICNLHALLSENLLEDPAACGRLRSIAVDISGTVFHPLELPSGIEERFQKILKKAEAIEDAYEQAFFVMVQMPYLQPFEDVNKRVSRLAANIPLIRHNLCPLSFINVPRQDYINGIIGVYELNRVEYLRDVFVWAYQRSCVRYAAVRQSLGDPDPFRFRYRNQIHGIVAEVVRGGMDKRRASRWIVEKMPGDLPQEERMTFVQMVETELDSLHEGNIARYRLRPSEYVAWKMGWK